MFCVILLFFSLDGRRQKTRVYVPFPKLCVSLLCENFQPNAFYAVILSKSRLFPFYSQFEYNRQKPRSVTILRLDFYIFKVKKVFVAHYVSPETFRSIKPFGKKKGNQITERVGGENALNYKYKNKYVFENIFIMFSL